MTGLFSDVYYEVERDAEFVLRERGSKFYAYVYGVKSEAEVKEKLEVLKREYPDATHHCYAWVMGARGEGQRANDDGEPGNSAGRPILRAIISAGLTNVLVVVVRYFGGTLLGIPGLIEVERDAEFVLRERGRMIWGQMSFGFGRGICHDGETDRKSTRLDSSHSAKSRMPSSS